MKKHRKVIVSLIALTILISATSPFLVQSATGGASPPAGTPAEITEKVEVVYAKLSLEGEILGVYIVNNFALSKSGSITDYGNYTAVTNLTDLNPVTLTDGKVTAAADGESFCYQGYSADNNLPWSYNIEYRIDGARVDADSVAGRSGKLEIRITSGKNHAADSIFYDNYMQQLTLTLKNDNCSNIKADGATIASVGKNRMLVYTILPGKDADITITADVADFEMDGIDISAIPFSMNIELPDFDLMIDDFSELSDAIIELNDGVYKLEDGAAEMASGSLKLKDGSLGFMDGLAQLNANSGQLTGASKQIKNALSLIASSISGFNGSANTDDLELLPAALSGLALGLDQISLGMNQLAGGYAAAYSAVEGAINGIPEYVLPEAQFYSLYAKADDAEKELLNLLAASYTASMTVKVTYESTRQAFASVSGTLDGLAGSTDTISFNLKQIAAQLTAALSGDEMMEQLKQLSDGLSELSSNYNAFHKGLESFAQGLSSLSGGYYELNKGVSELSDGLVEISGGITELYDGTDRLAEETSGIPDKVRDEIDTLTQEYTGKDFKAVSFASDKNDNIDFVQFVFKTDGIEKPETEAVRAKEPAQPNIWERIIRLFIKQ